MQFEIPKERPSIIKVIGIGGGGSNAVNHMFHNVIRGVEFLVCNTDHQALEISPVPHKIQLGPSLTEGRGAGSMPEVGKNAAIENLDDIRKALSGHTKMVFLTAGMGGGTGTGAAPIIAGVAREMGILTVAIVTMPFTFEGKKRKQQAEAGIEELKKNVDTLLVICNDKLREIHGNLKLAEAFSYADNVLATAARSIAEIISVTLHINVDFADVQTVMKESGVAIMGSATASGEDRALRAVESALDSPLLNDNNIEGARYILLNITSGSEEVTMDEMGEITDYIQEQAGQSAEVIMGVGTDAKLEKNICVTLIATGFKTKEKIKKEKPIEKKVYKLMDYVNDEKEVKETAAVAAQPHEPYLINNESAEEKIIEEDKVYLEEIPEPVSISPLPVDEIEEEIAPLNFEVETAPKGNIVKFDLNTSMVIEETPAEEKKEAMESEPVIKFELNAPVPAVSIPEQEKQAEEIKEPATTVELKTSMPWFTIPKPEKKEEEIKEVTAQVVPKTSMPLFVIPKQKKKTVVEKEIPAKADWIKSMPVFVIPQQEKKVTEEKEIPAKTDLNKAMPVFVMPPQEEKITEENEVVAESDLNTSAPVFEIPKTEIKEAEPKEAFFEIEFGTSNPVIESSKEEVKEEPKELPVEEVVMRKPFVPVSAEIKNTEEMKPAQETAAPLDDPHEELFRRSRERIMKLKEMNYRLNTPHGLADLEKEPAYKRRNIKLDDVPAAAENSASKYSLTEDQNKKVEIKPNNFLHDKVD
ncbi:MAG: cell division protein FtsZ [Bacteroidota bacterium]